MKLFHIAASEKYSTREIMGWLWRAWRGNRLQAVLNALVGLASVCVSLTQVWAVKHAIDVASGAAGGNIYVAVAIMGGLILCDFGLNIFNSEALRVVKELGVVSATLSFEMRLAQIRDIRKCIDTEVLAYGRLPLMITENCIAKNCTQSCGACDNFNQLIDRKGEIFPVAKAFGCRSLPKKIFRRPISPSVPTSKTRLSMKFSRFSNPNLNKIRINNQNGSAAPHSMPL